MSKSPAKKLPGQLNRSETAASLGISVQAFDRWGVEPVSKVGRETFYDMRSVLDNRLEHQEKKINPPVIELDPEVDAKTAQEKLRLTTAQADAQELKNEQLRRRLVDVDFVTFALSRIAAEAASTLDTIALEVKRKHPDLEPRHIDTIQRVTAKARNVAAGLDGRIAELLDEFIDKAD